MCLSIPSYILTLLTSVWYRSAWACFIFLFIRYTQVMGYRKIRTQKTADDRGDCLKYFTASKSRVFCSEKCWLCLLIIPSIRFSLIWLNLNVTDELFYLTSECGHHIRLMYFTDEGESWMNVPNLASGAGKLTTADHWLASSLGGHSHQAQALIMTVSE